MKYNKKLSIKILLMNFHKVPGYKKILDRNNMILCIINLIMNKKIQCEQI
jgi:hypothetical protein